MSRRLPPSLLPAVALSASAALFGCAERVQPSVQESAEGVVAAPPAAARTTANDEMMALAERHADAILRVAPELATSLGVGAARAGEGFAGRLGDYSPLARDEAEGLNAEFLQALRAVDRGALTGTAAVTYDVLDNAYRLAAERNQFAFGGGAVLGSASPYLVTQLSGAHLDLPRLLLTEQPLATRDDARAYLSRLAAIGRALSETRDTLLLDAEAGVVPPAFALTGAARSIEGLTEPAPSEHPLVTHLAEAASDIEGLPADEARALTEEAERTLTDTVYPAYAGLGQALSSLVEAAGEEAGIWRLDEGAAFYEHALRGYGAGDRTPGDVHALGLAEVERISAEMTAIFDEMGADPGTVAERFARLAEDPTMIYPNEDAAKEALLASLREQTAAIQERAPDWFATLPPQGVEVRRIPTYEQDSAPGGYYTGPSLDGERPGIYWINLKDTADWPRYTLKTLTYHEAVPGHHFQIALQQDVADMPLVRNMMFLSEFGEGWALYAERVADEMGMYEDDPLGQLGRLQSELFRAARLVVDTGLHDKRWTREEAIDWMTAATGDTRARITREVERYAVWPGQATSYKLGQLKIIELRDRAEATLGDAFDVRAFHDEVLLDGSVPLPVLEAKMDRWVEARRAG